MRGVILGVVLLAAFIAVQHAHAQRERPVAELTSGQLEREARHSRQFIGFFRHHPFGRYAYAFRHDTCFSVRKIRRGRCFYVRNRVRHHEQRLARIMSRLQPLPRLGPLNCLACWDRVAECESGQTWNLDTGNGYLGGLQWLLSTWHDNGGKRYAWSPVDATRLEQISIASYMPLSHWPWCGKFY